jgi:hypothetical protein
MGSTKRAFLYRRTSTQPRLRHENVGLLSNAEIGKGESRKSTCPICRALRCFATGESGVIRQEIQQQAAQSVGDQMQQKSSQATAAHNNQMNTFKRGFSACMDAHGYSVK